MKRRDLLKSLTMAAGGSLYSESAWKLAYAQVTSKVDPKLVTPVRALVRRDGSLFQPLKITIEQQGAGAVAAIKVDGVEKDRRTLQSGPNTFELYLKPATEIQSSTVSLEINGAVRTETVELKPVRQMLIYILPHSHHDLGYTDLQANVEEKQILNITRGIELARKTAGYPEGSRFVWNLEVLWGADLYMKRGSEEAKSALIEAVQKGWVGLNGAYANELTGLCRAEELLQLFYYSTQLGKTCGIKVDSAMMSDVPGFSWGVVPAMSQAGIKYFSAAPNYFDRIGAFMVTWQDKPFWWVSPSGKEKILFWVPWTGYALSHVKKLGVELVGAYQDRMDDVHYPYDISYMRWSGHGDNAEPDPELSEFVREWNEKCEWPKFAIASTSTAFSAFEERYGSQLPQYRGDLTPYWEDGAVSSALETGLSRIAADRLSQATALCAVDAPKSYVPPTYEAAWRDVLLYSEHTWAHGAASPTPKILSPGSNGRSNGNSPWMPRGRRKICSTIHLGRRHRASPISMFAIRLRGTAPRSSISPMTCPQRAIMLRTTRVSLCPPNASRQGNWRCWSPMCRRSPALATQFPPGSHTTRE